MRLGSARTARDRFQEWVEAGVWIKLWQVLLEEYDELEGLDWSYLSVDGSMTKAPLATVGEKKAAPTRRIAASAGSNAAWSRRRRAPVGVTVAGANRNDHLLLEETLTDIVVRRPKPTKARPQGLCLDKGYDYASTREIAARLRLTLHLRTRGEEAKAKRRGAKARRWVVERAHSWLNRFRRLLVRWEKKASNYEAMLHLACATIVAGQTGLFG